MKVGLIGCGGIASTHIEAYQRIKGVEVVGLCDLMIDRANLLAKKYKIQQTYTNYWDLIEKNDLDLVDVCTPTSTHLPIVCDVAKAVPAILLEKPMALTTNECDKIINEVEKYNTKICINHLQIFSPLIKKVTKSIDTGTFDLFSVKTTQKESFEYLNKHNLAPLWNVQPKQGGIIWEVCAHLVYLQLHFLPNITEVYALGSNTKYEVYDNFAVLLKTDTSKFGLIELNWVSHETEIVYEFTDVNGIRMQSKRDYNNLIVNSENPPFSVSNVLRNMITDEKRIVRKWWDFCMFYIYRHRITPMYNLIEEYINSIKGQSPIPVTKYDGRNMVHVLESIKESLDTGKPVKVNIKK